MGARKRIRLLALGGTIASVRREGQKEVTPGQMRAAELLEGIPEIGEIAEVETGDVTSVGSHSIQLANMHELAREAERAFAEGCDGVVVTHGTDTVEETAYALALMLPRGRPLVLTGAMRNPTLLGPDGPANVYAAFLAATTPAVAGLGPVIVLNDEIHAARFATKLHSTSPATFVSPGAGPVGEVIEDRAYVWFRPAWEDHLGFPESLDGAGVELVRISAGIGDTLLRAATAARPAGIVIEGTGGGHVPPPVVPAIEEALAAGIPVVLARRTAGGRTLERTYRGPGLEADLMELGVIAAGNLSGHKARLRLLVGAALGRDPATLFPVE